MKAIVTGANGTVGKALVHSLRENGDQVIPWDRRIHSIDSYDAIEGFLKEERPDVVYHLAMASQPTGRENEHHLVNHLWPSELAWATRQLGIIFVYTSTVMVFSNKADGPFRITDTPDETEGYGADKHQTEEEVFSQNPASRVVRLGWQIGKTPGTNNMISFFHDRMKEDGVVSASRKWFPACSFLEDTAEGLRRVIDLETGLFHLNSNEKWSFFDIATALNDLHGFPWKIEANEDFVYDQRMVDDRLYVHPLEKRLPGLLSLNR